MPYIYSNPSKLIDQPVVGSGTCVDLIKKLVPGLQDLSTTSWCAGDNVMEQGVKIRPGTAIATFKDGRYPGWNHGNHAAIVLSVMPSGIWVVDQWVSTSRPNISRRLIMVPPRWKQQNANGSFANLSDNALAFYVIEKCGAR